MIPHGALDWLRSPELQPLWTAVHNRLLRNGRTVRGRLTLGCLTDEQRDTLGQLLGHALPPDPPVDLVALDRLLRRSAAGTGLIEVVEAIVEPIPDRRLAASTEAARRDLLREHARAAVAAAGLADTEWSPQWLDRLCRGGLLGRQSSADVRRLITEAATTLGLILGSDARLWSRAELAERVTGSAHGLDDDMLLTRLVLRGIALAVTGKAEPPAGAAERRELWETVGVAGDTVATTALTYGLRPQGAHWRAALLRSRSVHHAETHLTLREIRQLRPIRLAPQTVYICENPRVLEAAADARMSAALVCTLGNPTTVTLALLDALADVDGVRLTYHGDFDWPGIAIANRVMRRCGARPWRLTAADYRNAVAAAGERGTPLQPLPGTAVTTDWDPQLATAMKREGVAVHEEGVIDVLLTDLE